MKKLQPLSALAIFSITLPLLFPSCVSKKKYLTEVERRATCDTTLQQINTRNLALNREVAQLKLQLAEKTGERNAFREILDKQDAQIGRLEKEIEKLTSQTLDQQSVMDGALTQKTRELERQKAIMQRIKDDVAEQEAQLKALIGRVAGALPNLGSNELSMANDGRKATITLSEKTIFRSGTTRLNSKAFDILEQIANILMDYPAFDVLVVGHTDNKQGKTNNWDLSALRATAVVRMLTEDIGMPPNQILAAGKGEFKPATSNETSEGRASNRRTEIIILPKAEKILDRIMEAK